LAELDAHGLVVGYLTLHVGVGTFRPVTTEHLEDHSMHSEQVELSEELVDQVQRARSQRRRIVAVGTTVVRALESAAAAGPQAGLSPFFGPTRLFIKPGHQFRVVDSLFTNFHMPKSTLLALVAAFAGYDRMMAGYRSAIAQRYRFLSYGDAMWIPECYGSQT
jgi:S-adenosylmethionine:tRNA ribosyltransferase-isomerase